MDLFSSVKIIAFTNSHCYTRWVFILVTMAIEENIRVLVLIMSKMCYGSIRDETA